MGSMWQGSAQKTAAIRRTATAAQHVHLLQWIHVKYIYARVSELSSCTATHVHLISDSSVPTTATSCPLLRLCRFRLALAFSSSHIPSSPQFSRHATYYNRAIILIDPIQAVLRRFLNRACAYAHLIMPPRPQCSHKGRDVTVTSVKKH